MRILKWMLLIVLILIGTLAVLFLLVMGYLSYRNNHYWKFTETDEPIEAKYTVFGDSDVSYIEFTAENDNDKKYEIWYPSEMKESLSTYPLVIMANGTGIPASKYKSIFKHLASWGFIVVGNEDKNSRNGASTSATLDFMLSLNTNKESDFYGKMDVDNIGVAGHSQGGVGAINAVTTQNNGNSYKAMYTASTTSSFWGQEDQLGTDWSYDVSKITIPYFMVAGTGPFDAGTANDITATEGQGICPLWSMSQNYHSIDDTVMKVMARRVNTDHGDMLFHADGYMTAWFRWLLKGDEEAATAFIGDDAEIMGNSLYQDQQINLITN